MNYTKGECKCYADLAANGKPIMLKCPLCKAAPDMYEACVGAMKWWAKTMDSFYPPEFTAVVKALAKADGKTQ